MALEVARRLIDGVWQTIVGDSGASSGGSLPPDGVTGQALVKASDTTGDVAWGFQPVTTRLFTVNFDDANFNDPNVGVVLWTPAAGEVILDLWIRVVIAFAGADSASLYVGGNVNFDALMRSIATPNLIGINPIYSGSDFLLGGSAANDTLDARASGLNVAADGDHSDRQISWLPCEVGSNGTDVICAADVTNGPLTAGQLRIIAVTSPPVM